MHPPRILIVEDNGLVARDIEYQVRGLGYQVSGSVATGNAALEIVANDERRPDLVLMDIRLKGTMSGIETASQIRAKYALPVVFLTAYSDEHTVSQAREAEPYGYLLKPLNERELRSTIEISIYKHEMEKRLRESQVWFSSTLSSIKDCVIATDIRGDIRFMNPSAERLIGISFSRTEGKPFHTFVNLIEEDTGKPFIIPFEKLMEQESAHTVPHQVLFVKRNDLSIPVVQSIGVIRGQDAKVYGCVIILQDISEERRISNEVKKLREAVHHAAEAILICAVDGTIEYVNPAFIELSGYSYAAAMGQILWALLAVPGFTAESLRVDVISTVKSGRIWSKEVQCHRDDKTKEAWVTISPVYDNRVQMINLAVTMHDLTERKRLESLTEAINVMDNIGYVFTGISHELGNPVQSVTMRLKLLMENIETYPRDKINTFVGQALIEMKNIEDLLHSLKSFNLFEDVNCEAGNVSVLLKDIARLVKHDLKKQKIQFQTVLNIDNLRVQVDRRAFQQIMLNVITNAMDALKHREEPKIFITVEKVHGFVRFNVTDNGIGMSLEQQKSLFKPFYTGKSHGRGMGLVICRKLLASMQGTIAVRSKKGEGTTVVIDLPSATRD